jgi:hypothetical protein
MALSTKSDKPSSRFDVVIIDDDVLATQDGVEPKAGFDERGTDLAMSTMIANPREGVLTLLQRNVSKHLILQCDMTHVIHGTTVEGGSLATLIVLQFTFAARTPDRRFKEAEIEMTFSEAATVVKMEPHGNFAAEKSSIEREVSHTVSPSLAAAFGPANATMGYIWQRTDKKSVNDAIMVQGLPLSRGTTDNLNNQVFWSLSENKQTEKGIPSLFQGAVLLKRTQDAPFSASILIHGEVDNKRWAKDGWGNVTSKMSNKKLPSNDVWFDPKAPIGDNSGIDAKNLSRVPLESYKQLITVKDWADGSPQSSKEQPPRQDVSNPAQGQRAVFQDNMSTRSIKAEAPTEPEVRTASETHFAEPNTSVLNHYEMGPATALDWDLPTTLQTSQSTRGQPSAGGASQLSVLEQELALIRKEERLVEYLMRLVQEQRKLLRAMNSLKVRPG